MWLKQTVLTSIIMVINYVAAKGPLQSFLLIFVLQQLTLPCRKVKNLVRLNCQYQP